MEIFFKRKKRRYTLSRRRLVVRTPGFHPGNRSSILLGGVFLFLTKFKKDSYHKNMNFETFEKQKNQDKDLNVLINQAIKVINSFETGLNFLNTKNGHIGSSGLRILENKGEGKRSYIITADIPTQESYNLAKKIAQKISSRDIKIDKSLKEVE